MPILLDVMSPASGTGAWPAASKPGVGAAAVPGLKTFVNLSTCPENAWPGVRPAVEALLAANASAPPMRPAPAPAVSPPTAPALSASFRLPPANKVEPAEPTKPLTAATPATEVAPKKLAAAGPKKKPRATVVTIRPMLLLANFLTALPTLFSALPTPLKSFLRKNSGRPVLGLMVPEPPRRRSMRASAGVM